MTISSDDLDALLKELTSAEKGSRTLSRAVFMALGGEFREEAVSKQGGAAYEVPYVPGRKEPVMGVSFTTHPGDILAVLGDFGMLVGLNSYRGPEGKMRYRAVVENSGACANTPALALCSGLIAHLLAIRALGDTKAIALLDKWGYSDQSGYSGPT